MMTQNSNCYVPLWDASPESHEVSPHLLQQQQLQLQQDSQAGTVVSDGDLGPHFQSLLL